MIIKMLILIFSQDNLTNFLNVLSLKLKISIRVSEYINLSIVKQIISGGAAPRKAKMQKDAF